MRTLKWKFCNTFNNYSTIIIMRLNKYLFNRVTNKERERGQRLVIWLKRGGHSLRLAFGSFFYLINYLKTHLLKFGQISFKW